MVWFLNLAESYPPDTATMLADQWAEVGVRTTVQMHRPHPLAGRAGGAGARLHRLARPGGIHADARPALLRAPSTARPSSRPVGPLVSSAAACGRPRAAKAAGLEGPPPGHPARRAMELYDLAQTAPTAEARIALQRDPRDRRRQLWSISLATPPPLLASVKDGFRNVPPTARWPGIASMMPGNLGHGNLLLGHPNDPPGWSRRRSKASLTSPSPCPALRARPPDAGAGHSAGRPAAGLGTLAGAGLGLCCWACAIRSSGGACSRWCPRSSSSPSSSTPSCSCPPATSSPRRPELSLNGDPNAPPSWRTSGRTSTSMTRRGNSTRAGWASCGS
jgi:hypothetical protein